MDIYHSNFVFTVVTEVKAWEATWVNVTCKILHVTLVYYLPEVLDVERKSRQISRLS